MDYQEGLGDNYKADLEREEINLGFLLLWVSIG